MKPRRSPLAIGAAFAGLLLYGLGLGWALGDRCASCRRPIGLT